MLRTPRISAKDFLKYLKRYGCTELSTHGSHHKVRNDKNNKISTVAVHSNAILIPGLFSAILKQLEINEKEFIKFIEKN